MIAVALLNGSQQAYAELLAHATGLELATCEAWLLCEEPPSRSPELQGYNWLNLLNAGAYASHGHRSYSGVRVVGFSPAGFAKFATVADAATEAAFWIMRFSNYVGIRASAGKPPLAQVDAIAASPWDAGHYGNGSKIRATLELVERSHPVRRRLRKRWELRVPHGSHGWKSHRVHWPFLYGSRHGAIKRAARRTGRPIEIHPR